VRPQKFWTGIIKFGLVLTIVQNFTPVGPGISEISRSEKNKTSGLKLKSAPQAIAFGRTNKRQTQGSASGYLGATCYRDRSTRQ